jgi:hypothetical protein
MRMAFSPEVAPLLQDAIAGGPSFKVDTPYVPGRSLEGIPNANNPAMRDKIYRRFLAIPPGSPNQPQLPSIRGV